jgi:hypothetical protein
MQHTIYNTRYYLAEIDSTKSFGSDGIIVETWQWEITIAVHETTYKGKAVSTRKGALIDWVELKSMHPDDEMIGNCKNYMQNKL